MPTSGACLRLRVICALAFSAWRPAGTPGIQAGGPFRPLGYTRRDGRCGRTRSTPRRHPAGSACAAHAWLCTAHLWEGGFGASVSPRNGDKADLKAVLLVDDRISRTGANFKLTAGQQDHASLLDGRDGDDHDFLLVWGPAAHAAATA